VAVAVGVAAGLLSYGALIDRGYLASDFQWPLRAAQALLGGEDPYEVIVPSGPYPFHMHFYYPLPAALVALPFAGLDPYVAGALFFGIASGVMAFALADGPRWRFLMFASPSFMVAGQVAQWSPLFVAAALMPALQALAVCKPNLGLAAFLYRPTRTGVLAAAGFLAVSLVVFPTWPLSWISTTLANPAEHPTPLMVLPGFVLLLSLLAWRSPEGRLLAVMSILPQSIFWYDQLVLFLIPRTARQMIGFTIASWAGYFTWQGVASYLQAWDDMGWVVGMAPPIVLVTMYLPALALVLVHLRRNRQRGKQDKESQQQSSQQRRAA
jgi:hypothetical protein